jgi:hypothetical protein
MVARLLDLPDDLCSLEFDKPDLDAVRAAIRKTWGEPKIVDYAMSASVEFGGQSFTYQNEWDDPCLISSTPAGREILEALADLLNAPQP